MPPPRQKEKNGPVLEEKNSSTARPGLILRGRWKLGRLLGEGACGQVFAVEDVTGAQNEQEWVIKLAPLPPPAAAGVARKKNKKDESLKRNADTLYMEQLVYKNYLMGVPHVPALPALLSYGEDKGFRFLVMQRLGQDLSQLFESQGRYFSPATLADYGKQMLDGIQQMHERQLLFIDVKPENFMLGLPGTRASKRVFLVDLGLVEKYTGSNGVHKPQEGQGAAGGGVGTPLFSSLACHEGRPAGRRDDLEALGWVLLYFARGGVLPWASATSDSECLKMKRSALVKDLSRGVVGGDLLAQFLEMARKTAYEAAPKYAAFAGLLDKLGGVTEAGGKGGAGSSCAGVEVQAAGRKRKGERVVERGERGPKKGGGGEGERKEGKVTGSSPATVKMGPRAEQIDRAGLKSSDSNNRRGKGSRKMAPDHSLETDVVHLTAGEAPGQGPRARSTTNGHHQSLWLEGLAGPHKGERFELGTLEKAMYLGRERGGVALLEDKRVGGKYVKLEASGRNSVHSVKVTPMTGAGLDPVLCNNVAMGKKGRVLFAGDLLQVGESTLALRRA